MLRDVIQVAFGEAHPVTTLRFEAASNAQKACWTRVLPEMRRYVLLFAFTRFRPFCGMLGSLITLRNFSGIAKGDHGMADDSKINGFAWFLAGLGVGALAGILYAPKSGRETRDDLANSAREGSEYLRNRGKQVAEQVGTMVDRGREQVGEYMDRGKEAVDRGRAQWEEFVERGKSLVGDQGQRVSAAVDAGRQAYKSGSSASASNMTTGATTSTPSTTTTTGAS